MAIKIAQTQTGTSTLASTAIVWANNTTSGNLIIVAVVNTSASAGNVSGVSDSQGNPYTKIFATENGGTTGDIELWYAKNIVGGTTPTITVAYTAGVTAAAIAREYSGLETVTTLTQNDGAATGNNNAPTSNTIKVTNKPSLLIGVTGSPSTTTSAGGNFINLSTITNTDTIAIEDLYATSTGSYSAAFSDSGTVQWVCGIAAFNESPHGTTTSTSSTSMSSTSSSSTSSSTSSTSTSVSSTSSSTSSTSTSLSTSSTSSSISSTSSSISSTSSSTSSTSSSSTSSSTSISSTSSSVSSTSMSSTSTSSTSSSTSISSTSSSISSTSSSISSTSSSVSSTSQSSTSSSSSTSTTAIPLNLDYSYQDSLTLPGTSSDDIDIDTSKNIQNVAIDDGDYFIQRGSEYTIQEYKKTWINNTSTPTFTWKGRSTEPTSIAPLVIQIYNQNSAAWETLAQVTNQAADSDIQVTVTQSTNVSNYYNSSNVVTFRVYQQVL